MKKTNTLLIILLICPFIGSCSSNNLPKYALISNLRVLAMKATAPEVSPGDPIPVVSALVLDPDGGGRAISYAWVGCSELPTSSSTRFECRDAPDKISFGSGTSSNPGPLTVPAAYLDLFPPTLAYNGVSYIISLTITAGSETVTAFKRIVISSAAKTIKNANPSVSSLSRSGVALSNGDALGSGDEALTANVASASYESFNYLDGTGGIKTSREDLLITWFFTEGSMKTSRTFGGNQTNTWTAPTSKARVTVSLATVIHDGRGGTDWTIVNLQ